MLLGERATVPVRAPLIMSRFAEAEKLALQLNKFELALPSTSSGSSSMAVTTAAIVPWLWSLPPHEHSCVKVTQSEVIARFHINFVVADWP